MFVGCIVYNRIEYTTDSKFYHSIVIETLDVIESNQLIK